MLEPLQLLFHIFLGPACCELFEAEADERVGYGEFEAVEKRGSDIVGLAFPAISTFEEAVKFPDDESGRSLNYGAA